MPNDEGHAELIDRTITAIGVAPSLRKRAAQNLSKFSNEEIVERLERALVLQKHAQEFLDARRS